MLGGASLTSMSIHLGASVILEFHENLICTNKLNIEGFLISWEEVKKVLHLTFLVIRGTHCSHGSWYFTRKDNTFYAWALYHRKHKWKRLVVENAFGILKQSFKKFLYKIDIGVNLVLNVFTCCYLLHNLILRW